MTNNPDGLSDARALAKRFHEAYERLAPSFGYETRPDTKAFDPESANGRLMIAVCAELATPPASDAAVPAGFALVPVEPTRAMIEAACDMLEGRGNVINIWSAMLAAANEASNDGAR